MPSCRNGPTWGRGNEGPSRPHLPQAHLQAEAAPMVVCIQMSQFVLLLAGHRAELPMKIDLCKTRKKKSIIFSGHFSREICRSAGEVALPWDPPALSLCPCDTAGDVGCTSAPPESAPGPCFSPAILGAAREQGIQTCTCEIPSSPHICMKIPDLFK